MRDGRCGPSVVYVINKNCHEDCRIPVVRLPPELREATEALLQNGETLPAFVEVAVRRHVEFRQAQKHFIERGLTAGNAAQQSGKYISSAAVLGKLARRLEKARKST